MGTMTDTDKKPGEQSYGYRHEDAAEIAAGLKDYDDTEKYEAAQERLDSFALSVETIKTLRVVLGTGGPHDELLVTMDSDGDVDRVQYRYYHWFGEDLYERDVREGEPLWTIAEQYASYEHEVEMARRFES